MRKGFSLIEVVIVVFIVAAFILLFAGLVNRSREMGRTMSCINNMKQLVQAIESYQADWKDTPYTLSSLSPVYITNEKVFHCPADRSGENSYEDFYVNRPLYEEESRKIILACPRHYRYSKTVAAYLSYAVDIGNTQKVTQNGVSISPQKFGKELFTGQLKFADGTSADVSEGSVGILSSFVDNHGRVYSLIYIPETGEKVNVEITHEGNSQFEVITPSVIAGVAGTKFAVSASLTGEIYRTVVDVVEGMVKGLRRATGKFFTLKPGQTLVEESQIWRDEDTSTPEKEKRKKKIPRKPPKPRQVY